MGTDEKCARSSRDKSTVAWVALALTSILHLAAAVWNYAVFATELSHVKDGYKDHEARIRILEKK